MSNGPLSTYVPPGAYTRTLTEANAANLVAGLRIPALIGVGQEELEQNDLELVRGSSATLDQQIVSEDVSQRFVVNDTNPNNPILGAATGLISKFKVRNFPIVDGQGFGHTSNDVKSVSVTINGTPVAVGSLQGASGYVTLQVPAQAGDDVRCTYFFHRSDTSFTDDLSDQVTATTAALVSPGYGPFTVTLDTTDTFSLKVDGVSTSMTFTAGTYTAAALKSVIDARAISGLVITVFTDNAGKEHLQFTAAQSLEIGAGNANGALGFAQGTKTTRNATFRVYQRPIVDGTDGGITTTDPSKVTVKVNNVQVLASAVDGTNGTVTIAQAPAAGSKVTVTYWANTWQDTFDYLPNTQVTSVIRCGFASRRNDYIQGQDFVISNPSPDVSIVHWGASFVVGSATRTAGAELFDSTQIIPTLVDDKMFLVEAPRVVDTTVVPALTSSTKFTLPSVPTTGNGRDTPLGSDIFGKVANNRIGLNTNRPDLVVVYAGHSLRDALSRSAVKVVEVDAESRVVTLKNPVPPDHKLFASFWYNRLTDDTYILTNKVAGAVGVGQFEVYSTLTGTNVYQTLFGTKSGLSQTVQWPRGVEGIPDAFHTGDGTPVAETVTVTFNTAATTNAEFTNSGASPWSFYAGFSDQWRMAINGNVRTSNLNTAVKGFLVSSRVTPNGSNQITIPSSPNNVLKLTLEGTSSAAAGSITTVAAASLIDGETFTLNDGVHAATVFEFDSNATVTVGHVAVTFSGGNTATQIRDAIIAAVNGVTSTLNITAAPGTSAQVLLTNDTAGTVGNVTITETVANSGFTTIGMTGGTDSGEIDIAVTPGARTPAQIVTDINAAIDASTLFSGTAPNTLASFVQFGGSGNDVMFIIKSYSTPAALPGGFDHHSIVSVLQGTLESVLGFATFQAASGTPTATNKPATMLSSIAGTYAITTAVNDTLNVRVDGIDYAVTLPSGATVATSTIVTAINATPGLTGVASAGTLGNLNKLRLTSPTNNAGSSVVILAGTANATLGFTEGDAASYTLVTAHEVANEINSISSMLSTDGVAYADVLNGNTYLTIESITLGTSSSIAFTSGTASAYNTTAGTQIVPGTSGDVGEAARDYFTVTSNNASGSAGTGTPGQTYTDATTGLRFTILPATTGSYTATGFFTLLVSPTWKVNPAIPSLALGGVELVVTDTVGVGVDDTATVQTYDPHGLEPEIGDFYFISYRYRKQDFSTRLFQQFKSIEANFGRLSAENRLTLAAQLAILNGAVLVGIKQVLKAPNTNQASDLDFIEAIQEMATPLPGNIKPDVIVPLATSTTVYATLMQHCSVQSDIRNQSERMGFIGFASGTSPTTAQTIARGLVSNRIVAVYPDSAVVTLNNELNEKFETLVDGSFLAAAVAGAVVSPAVDVATPYTRRLLLGITRLQRVLDPVEANQTAVAGITLLENLDQIIRIRQGLTTDMTNVLTRLPTVTQIADFVQQQSRATVDSFIGTKFLARRTNEVEISMTALLKQLLQAEIIGGFTGVTAEVSPDDPTTLLFEANYMPIFPLLYILLTFNLRSRL